MSCQAGNALSKPAVLVNGGRNGNRKPCCQSKNPCSDAPIQSQSNESTQLSKLPCPPCPPCRPCPPSCLEELSEARKKYDQLQVDFRGKVTEIGVMRIAQEKLKQCLQDTEEAKKATEEKAKELERILKEFDDKFGGEKEGVLLDLQQQLAVAKAMYDEVRSELMDLSHKILDAMDELEKWMDKCLEQQQIVEEQKRRIDILELNSNRMNEQVCLEAQKLRDQFSDKLFELLPLPDILQDTKLKLQEAQQRQLLAEQNNETSKAQLQTYMDQFLALTEELEQLKRNLEEGVGEKEALLKEISDLRKTIAELEVANIQVKGDLDGMTVTCEKAEGKVQDNVLKVGQVTADLENLREMSADKVARIKDRYIILRVNMENKMADLERLLVVSRAQTNTAQKDREAIREKMEEQVHILEDNFDDAQMRIRNIQGHVNFFKNSYNTVCLTPDNADEVPQDPCRCGCGS